MTDGDLQNFVGAVMSGRTAEINASMQDVIVSFLYGKPRSRTSPSANMKPKTKTKMKIQATVEVPTVSAESPKKPPSGKTAEIRQLNGALGRIIASRVGPEPKNATNTPKARRPQTAQGPETRQRRKAVEKKKLLLEQVMVLTRKCDNLVV